jgi:hypothetical protein
MAGRPGIPDNSEDLPLIPDAHVVKGEGVNLALGSSFLRGSGASWGGASLEVLGAGPLAVLRAGALAGAVSVGVGAGGRRERRI